MTYCEFVLSKTTHEVHQQYHDDEYGFPVRDDNLLFERLVLEINQAGLSWETILKKRGTFRPAYAEFDVRRVAKFGESDTVRLLSDPGVIRNRLKVAAAIHNANVIVGLQKDHGSFKSWLDHNHPMTREEWTKLFKRTFKFTGGEIVNEFLMSTGYLPGTHEESCPVYKKIAALNPPWMNL